MQDFSLKNEERKAKAFGLTLTIVVHALLLLLFFLTAAWAPEEETVSDLGIEVNFGTTDFGSGETQSKTTPNTEESFDEAKAQPEVEEVPEPTPAPTPTETPAEPVNNDVQAFEGEAEESVEATPKEEEPKPKAQQEPEPVEKPQPEEPKEEANPATLLGGGQSNTPKANSNGNTEGDGDMGDESGNVNADALIGESTGKGGSSLDMPGWKWENPPTVNDQSNVRGKIVFEVKIDDEGEIVTVKRVYSDIVDRSVVQSYYQAVRDLSFVQENSSARTSMLTTGRITFIITTR